MPIDFLKILKDTTDKFELQEEIPISKTQVVQGLKEVVDIVIPPDVQDWMPENITIRKLKIDRTTQPKETYEIEMVGIPPPIFAAFPKIIKTNKASFEIKTNQK